MSVESKIDRLLERTARIEEKLDNLETHAADREARIRVLESARARLAGIATAVAAVVAFAASKLRELLWP